MNTTMLSSASRTILTGVGKWLSLGLLCLSLSACQVEVEDDASTDDQKTSQDDKNTANKDDKKNNNKQDADAQKQSDQKKEKPAIPVEVAKLARGDIQQTYRAITTLEAENEAQIVARSTGILQKLMVEEGDRVKKGQLLAQLDIEQLALEVSRLEATTSKLKKEKQRQESLYKRNLTSRDALDRASYEYQAQSAQLALSKLRLDYASIKAPINGMIVERHVKRGNLIRENDLLFKIVDLDSLKAVLYLPESELKNIKIGQPVYLQIPAVGDQLVTGTIERIRPTIDTTTGTFRVVATVANPQHQLKTGMFGKVEVVFDEHKNSLLLAQEAIITQDNRSHVFVIREHKAIQTPIKTGFRREGVTEIVSGLKDDDLVVTTGQQILKHESKVEIVNQEILDIANKSNSGQKHKPSVVSMN